MSILSLLFDCPHGRLTWPQTAVNRRTGAKGDTTVSCLDCGRTWLYSWQEMRREVEVVEAGPRKTWEMRRA